MIILQSTVMTSNNKVHRSIYELNYYSVHTNHMNQRTFSRLNSSTAELHSGRMQPPVWYGDIFGLASV